MPPSRSGSIRPLNPRSLSWEECRLLVESVVDYAIFVMDVDGRVATWNLGAEKIKGYRADEIIEEHFSKFYTPHDVAAGKPQRLLEVARAEGRAEDEGWRVRKDGSLFWGSVVITALRDQNGKLRGFGKVTRDLTAKRAAEEELRRAELRAARDQAARELAEENERRNQESEERYRALSQRLEIVLQGVADGITVQDTTGRVVFANAAAARICGLESGQELMDMPAADLIERFDMFDSSGRPFPMSDLPGRRALAHGGETSAVMHVRERRTRRDWWVHLKSRAVLDSEGKPELAVSIWHDVTLERRHEMHAEYLATATAALGDSLVHGEMLSTFAHVLVPGLADWCSIYLIEGDRLRDVASAHADPAKQAAVEAYRVRYAPDREHAGRVWNVVRTGKLEIHNDITDELLATSTSDPEALATLRSLGMRAALIVPIRARARVLGAMALVSTDSARRYDAGDAALAEELGRRAGVALENAYLYAAALEASSAKDEFLATVSHELRTPLSAILGWATILKNRVKDPEIAKPIEVIHRNSLRQIRLIDDLMDVSGLVTGKFHLDLKTADFVAITKDAIEVIRPSALKKQIELSLECSHASCVLVADPERLKQVVWNLLSNAVNFTDSRGKIRVSLRQEGSNVVLSVTDTGRGIDPEFLPFVFDRFKQADPSTTRRVGGLGVGLALVRHIVELHGGRVTASSEGVGKGATFVVTVPIRAVIPEPSGCARPSPSEVPISGAEIGVRGVRVLVVDDEIEARDLVRAVLTRAGAVVQTAASAAEGFIAFRSFRPDVLVSDIAMPDEDGFSLMRRIRALLAREGGAVPSLALTAFARKEDRAKAIAAGYTMHVGKPVVPSALTSAVAQLAAIARER